MGHLETLGLRDLMMISVENARNKINASMPLMSLEQIGLPQALGRVLGEDLMARRTQPPKPVSSMDGYAAKIDDLLSIPTKLKVVGEIPAGTSYDGQIKEGESVRIFTGAPVPKGADLIIIQENTQKDGEFVKIIKGKPTVGQFIRPAGLDFNKGEILLKAGRTLTSRDIGLIAGMNIPWLMVRRRPKIAILATGYEIVMPGNFLGSDQIVSSNGLALSAFINASGGETIDLGIAPDTADDLQSLAKQAKNVDMLVTCGGASVGEHDLVQKALSKIGLEIEFWRIAMRPGKPLMFGKIGTTKMLGLPGNPVSAFVCAIIFIGPALNSMLGTKNGNSIEPETAILTKPLKENDEREDYLRAILVRDSQGTLIATPFDEQDSSIFSDLAHADGLVIRSPYATSAKKGDIVKVISLSG